MNRMEIRLRKIEQENDYQTIKKWFEDEKVMRYLSKEKPREYTRERWARDYCFMKNLIMYMVEAIEDGSAKSIGYCGFSEDGTLGVAIGDVDYWGKGCAKKACSLLFDIGFEKGQYQQILSHVDSRNIRSRKLHKSLGFKISKKKSSSRNRRERKSKYHHGCELMFVLTKEAWTNRKQQANQKPVFIWL